jgi:hypothetical protein
MESLRAQDYPFLHLEHVLFRIKPRSKHFICRQISAGTKTLGEHLVRIQESLSGTEQRQGSKSAWTHSDFTHAGKPLSVDQKEDPPGTPSSNRQTVKVL